MTLSGDPDPTIAPTAHPAAVHRAQRFVVVYLVDLRCLACGRDVGVLEAGNWPCTSPVLFQRVKRGPVLPVADWRRLRCDVCNGNVYADEIWSTRVYPALSREEIEPRRGRPPKSLVVQRRAVVEGVPD